MSPSNHQLKSTAYLFRRRKRFESSLGRTMGYDWYTGLRIFMMIAWYIGYNRNRVVHGELSANPTEVGMFVLQYISDFDEATRAIECLLVCHCARWNPPPCGVFKVNYDVALSFNKRLDGHWLYSL